MSGIYINGPLNIITLNKNNKKITILADFHEDVDKETNCNNDNSIELESFINGKIHELSMKNKHIDIFIETIPMNHTDKLNNLNKLKKLRYADKVINLLMNTFNEKDNIMEITTKSNKFPNITLHFVDIRNLVFPNMDKYFVKLSILITKVSMSYNLSDELANNIKSILDSIYYLILFTYNKLFGIDHLDDHIDDDSKHIMTIFFNKIKSSYKNNNVKDAINSYINTEFKQTFDTFFKLYNEINEFIDNDILKNNDNTQHMDDDGGITYDKSYITVKTELHKLDILLYKFNVIWFVEITSKVMDLYLIRKFLNNDIESCITYTGIEHFMTIIYLLVKYFNFDIESMSLLNDITKDQLINEIKNNDNKKGFHKYLYPKKLIQCTSDTGFTIV